MRLCVSALFLPLLCSAFPDHLQGRGGCLTELSTDEVIMNAWVIPYEKSRDPEVRVAVRAQGDDDNTVLLESPIVITKVPVKFEMVLTNPNQLDAIQYVMDTTEGAASFVRGVCDDKKRVTGRMGSVHTLVIDKIPETPIQVWAGWAAGREAVTLTNYFYFTSASSDNEEPVKAADEL